MPGGYLTGYFTGYFTRDQGAVARACSVIAAVLVGVEALTALVGFDIFRLLVSGLGAWAFAANLQAALSRRQRVLAIVMQILVLLGMLGLVFLALMIADGGRRGWQAMPAWLWLGIAAAFTLFGVAAFDGIRAYREQE